MTVILTTEMATALQDGRPRGLLVAIEHPSGTGYFSSGVGSVQWNGQTWAGTGKFGSVSPIKHTSEIAVQDIVFSLSGVEASIVAQLNDDVCNLNGSVWLYCLGDDGAVIADPYKIIDSQLDFQTFQIGADGMATIAVTAHSGFYTLQRNIEEAWTPENQQLLFPGDVGLDRLYSLQNQDLQWKPL